MAEISSEDQKRLRLPLPYQGVNVNFCKNPHCPNFGIEAELEDQRGRSSSNSRSAYRVTGKKSESDLLCMTCGGYSVVKSNKAVWEEFERHLQALALPHGHRCTKVTCSNHTKPLDSHPGEYYRHGTNASGDLRYRCRECRTTFSAAKGHARQRTSHENKTVFQLLVAKVALTRIAQVTGLNIKTVYDKIDFIHGQCVKFVAERERRLPTMDLGDMRLCTDMQDYMVNWPTKRLRKTIQFRAIATSCLNTGYVLACHPQLDLRLSTVEVQKLVNECGDLLKRPAFREYARLWNFEDYASALQLPEGAFLPVREDQESPEHMTDDRQLPKQGAMVHIDYLAIGHFRYLRHLLGRADRVTFTLDADPGLPTAVLASWVDKAMAKKLDVAVMSFDKNATIDEKNDSVAKSNKLKADAEENYPFIHPFLAWLTHFLKISGLDWLSSTERSERLRTSGVHYPYINKSEPGKHVRLYTDDGSRMSLQIARVLHDISLHQVDRFFMQVRRSIAGLERAPSYPRRASRKWYLYGFYSPDMVEKTLVIFRTYFNFIAKGKDGKTPAMRLGLAKGPVRFEDILYFD
ncbi:IS1 family transposase [Rhizobium sp. 16-449-1b]|nr:IS1 family transposase [Rhizobium sp. 16-449-1b]